MSEPLTPRHDLLSLQLSALIGQQNIEIHFQPLVDINRGSILGYEALTRGPADSPLHSPLVLFDLAARLGRLVELERVVVRKAVSRFRELALPGQLFLNLTVDTLMAAEGRIGEVAQSLIDQDLPPSRVVIELTETRPIDEPARLSATLQAFRQLGFVVALDDLGEGFASLKRWMDIRPDYVKVDRHFIDGIAQEPLKQQFVRSILEMAATSGCTVIAEGIETTGDLNVLRGLGVPVCQGYLLARPTATPRTTLRAEITAMLRSGDGPRASLPTRITTAAHLAQRGHTVSARIDCQAVVDMFQHDEQLYAMPVLDDTGRPIGILRSLQVLKRSAERFFMDIHKRHSCTELMDRQPLVFDVSTPLRAMSETVSNLDERLMVDGFIVTKNGEYFGSGRTSDLLKAVSDLQLSSARYANPLTLLPGNVPIDHHVEGLLAEGKPFVVALWDIDNFKPFNDSYGYRIGDDVIKFAALALVQAADPELDFVGHIGGDDYLMVLCSPDWQQRLTRICAEFDEGARQFFSAEHVQARGYITLNRQNQESFNPLPTFSAGVLVVQGGQYENAQSISAALIEPKRVAKSRSGGSRFFVCRREASPTVIELADSAAPRMRA